MGLKRIQQRREKRNKILMSIALSILMVMSGFGILLSSIQSQAALTDFGLPFQIHQDLQQYSTEIDGEDRFFFYLPSSVQHLDPGQRVDYLFADAQAIIVTFNPQASPTNLQLIDLLRHDLSLTITEKPVIQAITEPTEGYNLPIAVCANATAVAPIIQIEEHEKDSISIEGSCIKIQGNTTGLIQGRDYLLYDYYGVFE